MLATAKTPQDFKKILEEGSSSFSQENSYAESDDSTSYLPDNGDDCEGILPPIRNYKASWYHRHPGQGHMQWKQELCHDSKQRRGLENTKDIQQRNLKRRNQKLVSS